ncbi:MAG TPA: hypothetical protein VGZ29_07650 [Terriglobia bacterium]|nr:hypothetical protein [Terriglobia bacterium]
MKLLKVTMTIGAALVLTCACSWFSGHSKGAVEQAVNDHLAQNRNLKSGSFRTRIESVNFKGDNADAVVRFESTQSSALFVEVRYGLQRQNGKWEVVSSTPMSGQGGDSHGSAQDQNVGPPPASEPAGSAHPAPQPSH